MCYITGSTPSRRGLVLLRSWRHHSSDINGVGGRSLDDLNIQPWLPVSVNEYATPIEVDFHAELTSGCKPRISWTFKRLSMNLALGWINSTRSFRRTICPMDRSWRHGATARWSVLVAWNDLAPSIGAAVSRTTCSGKARPR